MVGLGFEDDNVDDDKVRVPKTALEHFDSERLMAIARQMMGRGQQAL